MNTLTHHLNRARLALAIAIVATMAAFATGSSIGIAHPGHLTKSTYTDRLSTAVSINDVNTYLNIGCVGTCLTDWTAVWAANQYQFNNSPTDIHLNNHQVTLSENSDFAAFVMLNHTACQSAFGFTTTWCMPTVTALGQIYLLVEAPSAPPAYHSQCSTTPPLQGDCYPFYSSEAAFTHVVILMNNFATAEHADEIGVSHQSMRQGVMIHEFGHAFGLNHEARNGNCPGPSQNITIMNEDCLFQNVTNGFESWDSCGINHIYPSTTWGYSGC